MNATSVDAASEPRGRFMRLRSIIHTVVFVVTSLVWGLLSLFTVPFPYKVRYWFITRWTHFNLWAFERICGVRCVVEGLENIPAEPGVVMAKHQSTWETMALQVWFTPQTWVLKRELLQVPLWGWAMRLLDPVAIDRDSRSGAMRQVVKEGAERMKKGRWLVIFPEGTRMPPGEKGRYQPGGAAIASRLGAKIVPVAHNAGEHWSPHRFLRTPGVIRVRIGEPVDTEGKPAKAVLREVEQWIEGQMPDISRAYGAAGDVPADAC